MSKRGKHYRANLEKVDRTKKYGLEEALSLIEAWTARKFDESVEVSFNLGVDPKQSDQMVRGAVVLPHGLGKTVRIVVIAKGEAETQAREAGADHVGNADLIEKMEKGWLDFDVVIATPDAVRDLTKVARVLGPKGLMPNKKTGTVTAEVAKAVKDQKLGKVAYRVEKAGIAHTMIGKKSFGAEKLKDNFLALYDSVLKQKPPSSKGIYIRKVSVSTTMGPGLSLDPSKIEGARAAS